MADYQDSSDARASTEEQLRTLHELERYVGSITSSDTDSIVGAIAAGSAAITLAIVELGVRVDYVLRDLARRDRARV